MRTREQIVPLGPTGLRIACWIGGWCWPLFQEPIWLQRVAHVLPAARGMTGLHDLILCERTLVEVLPKIAVLMGDGVGGVTIGSLLSVRREGVPARSDSARSRSRPD